MDAERQQVAYLVDCDGENGAQVYFAKTRGQAKAQAASDEDCRITEVLSCKRIPELDRYAPGPVPARVMMDLGWWFECSGCHRRVYGDDNFDYDEDVELTPVTQGASVWCSAECKHRSEIRAADEKIREAEERKAAIRALEMRFPGAVFRTIHARYKSPAFVIFDLPGRELSQGVGWEVGSSYVNVAPIDRAAWDAYEDARMKPVYSWEDDGGKVA